MAAKEKQSRAPVSAIDLRTDAFSGGVLSDGVSVTYTNFYRIAGGKIAENWYLSDSLGLAEQLGMKLVPADAGK